MGLKEHAFEVKNQFFTSFNLSYLNGIFELKKIFIAIHRRSEERIFETRVVDI